MSEEDQFLQENGTLKNLLRIQDPGALKYAEADLSALRIEELYAREGPSGRFDLAHLKDLHREIFQDVYEWAGKTRGERIQIEGASFTQHGYLHKGDSTFAHTAQIEPYLNSVFQRLAQDNHLRATTREVFTHKAADLLADLNAVHPFREGNGRTQRALITQLAEHAGHTVDFSVISQERMIQASIDAMNGHNEPMRRMMLDATSPDKVRMLQDAIRSLEHLQLNWNEMYLATANDGRQYSGRVTLKGAETVVLTASDQVIVARTRDAGRDVQLGQQVAFTAGGERSRGLEL